MEILISILSYLVSWEMTGYSWHQELSRNSPSWNRTPQILWLFSWVNRDSYSDRCTINSLLLLVAEGVDMIMYTHRVKLADAWFTDMPVGPGQIGLRYEHDLNQVLFATEPLDLFYIAVNPALSIHGFGWVFSSRKVNIWKLLKGIWHVLLALNIQMVFFSGNLQQKWVGLKWCSHMVILVSGTNIA